MATSVTCGGADVTDGPIDGLRDGTEGRSECGYVCCVRPNEGPRRDGGLGRDMQDWLVQKWTCRASAEWHGVACLSYNWLAQGLPYGGTRTW